MLEVAVAVIFLLLGMLIGGAGGWVLATVALQSILAEAGLRDWLKARQAQPGSEQLQQALSDIAAVRK